MVMFMSELVSIIVPTLNEEEHLEKLIKSVYNQRYRPLELIFVDGGSTDHTLRIIRKCISEMNRQDFTIKLLHEKDFGKVRSLPNARNIGIENAKSNFILLLDADMMFLENDSIDKIKKELERVNYCSFKTKPLIDTKLEFHVALDSPRFASGCYRKEVFEKEKFNPELGFGEDADFWFRANIDLGHICNTTLGRHYPHTIREWKKQLHWYGRTFLRFVVAVYKRDKVKAIKELFARAGMLFYLAFPFLFIVLFFYNFIFAMLFLNLLLILIFRKFYFSSIKSIDRLIYLIWSPFFYSFCFMEGLIMSIIIKRYREAKRDF